MLVSLDGHELMTPVKKPRSGIPVDELLDELLDLLFILLYTPTSFWHS
jgi:hypothetical protein